MIQNGDVIFVNYSSREIEVAITKVEQGYKGNKYNHVGMYFNGKIIEATTYGVEINDPKSFFFGADEKVLVARHNLGTIAASHADELIGKPYNKSFIKTDKEFYCSELVHYLFELANDGPLFKTHKLSFSDGEEEVSEFWIKYYSDLGLEVPIGESGSNPGNLSASTKFDKKIIINYNKILN